MDKGLVGKYHMRVHSAERKEADRWLVGLAGKRRSSWFNGWFVWNVYPFALRTDRSHPAESI